MIGGSGPRRDTKAFFIVGVGPRKGTWFFPDKNAQETGPNCYYSHGDAAKVAIKYREEHPETNSTFYVCDTESVIVPVIQPQFEAKCLD